MYKKTKKANIPYVYAMFVKPKGEKDSVLLVLNECIPIFTTQKTANDFHKTMVKGKIEEGTEVTIAKVVVDLYDPKKHNKKA